MYKCIVAGYDGSRSSRVALEKSIELARLSNARVYIVTVVPRTTLLVGDFMVPDIRSDEKLREEATKRLDEVVEELKEKFSANRVEGVVKIGDPAEEILNVARDKGCGLVVVGKRGLGVLERLMIGSVSSKIVSIARGVDVLVVST